MDASGILAKLLASPFMRAWVCGAALLLVCGGASAPGAGEVPAALYYGQMVPIAPARDVEVFEQGFGLFAKVWSIPEGLGPAFNATSCAACHHIPQVGGTEFARDKFVAHVTGERDALGGNSLPRYRVVDGSIEQRVIPPGAAFRKPQNMYGIGLLEAISDEDLLRHARRNEERADGVRGRLPVVDGRYARFGWKSEFVDVEHFVGGALLVELGLTNPRFMRAGGGAPEVATDQVRAIADYLRLLAPPPHHARGNEGPGGRIFAGLGCDGCHVASWITRNARFDYLNERTIRPYTDLLLHNMGPALAEPIPDGGRSASEFRTPPLWGLDSNGPPYLHDGRAESIEAAITLHGGEARAAAVAYARLSPVERAQLIAFLRSL